MPGGGQEHAHRPRGGLACRFPHPSSKVLLGKSHGRQLAILFLRGGAP